MCSESKIPSVSPESVRAILLKHKILFYTIHKNMLSELTWKQWFLAYYVGYQLVRLGAMVWRRTQLVRMASVLEK